MVCNLKKVNTDTVKYENKINLIIIMIGFMW